MRTVKGRFRSSALLLPLLRPLSAPEISWAWLRLSSRADRALYSGCGLSACSAWRQSIRDTDVGKIQSSDEGRQNAGRRNVRAGEGIGQKWLAVLFFALFAALAAFGIGCVTRSRIPSPAPAKKISGVPTWITGILLAALVAIVIIGGVKSISKVCEKLVPFMAIFYVLGCIIILIINYQYILPAVVLILKSAFSVQAGFRFSRFCRDGKRFVSDAPEVFFSNESGLGSRPLVAAAAKKNR